MISIGALPTSALCGILFFVYAAYSDALSHRFFGIPPLVEIIAVRHIVRIVRFARSAMAFVSLCRGMVPLRMIPRYVSSISSALFLNSLPQSACTYWTR
jgi:hypothetical protein